MNKVFEEALVLFGKPLQWIDPSLCKALSGMERPNAFRVTPPATLEEVVPAELMEKTRNAAVIGIHPLGIATAFQIKEKGCCVTLLPSGCETGAVKNFLGTPEISAFFAKHGIALRPQAAKQLRGSQVHCQSGYCGFVCEGRFIEESAEVGRVITEGETVYAEIVVLVDA